MSFSGFLFLLPLLIIPVILHILSRKYLERKDFPSLIFLLKSDRKIIRWFRIKEILLLVLRLLFLVFIILAACNILIPFQFYSPGEETICDISLSMENHNLKNFCSNMTELKGGEPLLYRTLLKYPIGILLSDMQINGFQYLLESGKRFPGIRAIEKKFPNGNFAVLSHQIGVSVEENPTEFSFRILNDFRNSKEIEITLNLDGREIETKRMILQSGMNRVDFSVDFKSGLHGGYLKLDDKNGFIFDNRYYFSLYTVPYLDIYILSENQPVRIQKAINSTGLTAEWIDSIKREYRGDLLIVDNYKMEGMEELLSQYKSVIICCSENTGDLYSSKIPERISQIQDCNRGTIFDEIKGLNDLDIYYGRKLKNGEPVLFMENGDDFLSRDSSIIFLTLSLNSSDFTLHPVSIPFLYRLIEYSCHDSYNYNTRMGETVVIESESQPSVVRPDGSTWDYKFKNNGKFVYYCTEKPGLYSIIVEGRNAGYIAVNPPVGESKLEKLGKSSKRFLFGREDMYNGATFFLILALFCFLSIFILEKK